MAVQLSTLQPIELREAWPHEVLNFTPWLADNLQLLSDLLGMELELISTEHPVGAFNLDIHAKDLRSNEVVGIKTRWNAWITPM